MFGRVANEAGETMTGIVAYRKCYNILKYHGKTTSNLVKHKCYLQSQSNQTVTTVDVDQNTKTKTTEIVTNWAIENCRPFKIVNDTRLRHLIQHCIEIGATFGQNVNIETLVPHPTTISNNLAKLYEFHHKSFFLL